MIRPRDDGPPAPPGAGEERAPRSGAGSAGPEGEGQTRSPRAAFPAALRAGWSLPLELAGDGRFPAERAAPVADTARLILEVVPGERRLLPEFGCRVHWLPSVDSAADRELAAALIEEALERWAPALRVERAEVTSVEDGTIALRLRAWNSWHALAIRHRRPIARGSQRAPWLEGFSALVAPEGSVPEAEAGAARELPGDRAP